MIPNVNHRHGIASSATRITRRSSAFPIKMPPHHHRPEPRRDSRVELAAMIPRVPDGAAAEVGEGEPTMGIISIHFAVAQPPGTVVDAPDDWTSAHLTPEIVAGIPSMR